MKGLPGDASPHALNFYMSYSLHVKDTGPMGKIGECPNAPLRVILGLDLRHMYLKQRRGK